jgi:hypothetical protein
MDNIDIFLKGGVLYPPVMIGQQKGVLERKSNAHL